MSNTAYGGTSGNTIGKGAEGSLGKERIHCNGLKVTGSVEAGNVVPGTISKITSTGVTQAIPTSVNYVEIISTTGADLLTLADGREGQEITIMLVTDGGSVALTPATFANGTTLTFATINFNVVLRFSATGGWHTVGTPTAVVA